MIIFISYLLIPKRVVLHIHPPALRFTDDTACRGISASFVEPRGSSWLPVFDYKQGRGLIIAANGLVIATNRLVATASSVLCIVDGDRVNSLPN